MILTAPHQTTEETTRASSYHVAVNTVQHDLRAYNLTLNEAVDLAQNRPLSVEADVYVWCNALLVVHARTEEEEPLT